MSKIYSVIRSSDAARPATATLVENTDCPLGTALVNPNKSTKQYEPQDLVALAQTVQKADEFVRANATNKLTQIAKQMQFLQEQARLALEEAKRDAELHHAACNLVKMPGTTYHLYERSSGQRYMSILSPQEWGLSMPHEHVGSYRLEYDQSWTPVEDIVKRSEEFGLVNKLLNSQLALTDGL